jgi:hypothetical protein
LLGFFETFLGVGDEDGVLGLLGAFEFIFAQLVETEGFDVAKSSSVLGFGVAVKAK